MKLKHVTRFISGGTPDTDDERFWSESGIPWVSIGDMSTGRAVVDTAKSITLAGVADRRLTIGGPGTVLFAMYASVGAVATLGIDATWNQAILGLQSIPDKSNPRFIEYWLRHFSPKAIAEARSATQANLNADQVANFPFPDISVIEQRRIADFLDDRVGRIDRIITARREQDKRYSEAFIRLSYEAICGARLGGGRQYSGLEWLGIIPESWPVVSVSSQFAVELGKMLDESRQVGTHRLPYLRNTNVQWDYVNVEDLKQMDISPEEHQRYTVYPGDLLVCEGGQPGRSAIWSGEISPIGFQKALHRARSRGRSRPEWLLECLRVASGMEVFSAATGQTTISHLTNQQLREQKFPFPDPRVQDEILADLGSERERLTVLNEGLGRSIDLLAEYKSSLITDAVSGELDVTTAGSGIPG